MVLAWHVLFIFHMTKQLTFPLIAAAALTNAQLIAGDTMIAPSSPAAVVSADETPNFGLDIGMGYTTKYIWRGLDLGNDMVELSVEATGSYAGLDLTAGAWYAHVSDQQVGLPKGELDLYLAASKDLGYFEASTGYVFYHFANNSSAAEDAQEIFFKLRKEIAGYTASVTYFWDIETDNQGYSELAIEKSFTIPMSTSTVDVGVVLGYLAEESALSHLTAKISKGYELHGGISATPYIAYTVELEGLERNYGTTEQNEFFAGLGLGYSF